MLKYTEKRVNYKILAISLLFFSCTSNLAILSLASTKDVNMNLKHKNIGSVSGKDNAYFIWFVPIGESRIDQAIQNALNNNNIDYLTNVSVDQTFVHLYLFGIITTNVNGIGWKEIEVQYDPLTGEKIN